MWIYKAHNVSTQAESEEPKFHSIPKVKGHVTSSHPASCNADKNNPVKEKKK